MAHNALGRLLRCRSPNALQQSISLIQKRAWSARSIPSFMPTSSRELNDTLNRFRDELFIPHALNDNQRNLMYKSRHQHKIQEHPIVVPIGEKEEPYQLRPIDPFKTPTRKDAVRVINLMAETRNWSNLVIFLTGLYKSGMSLRNRQFERLIRKAGETNGLGPLLMAAQQAKETHLTLDDTHRVDRLFFQLHLEAQQTDFTGPELLKILRIAKSFVVLMEAPEHAVAEPERDPKRAPLVAATLLELSAASALAGQNTVVVSGLESLVQRLAASLKAANLSTSERSWVALDHLLQQLVPAYNGLKLALKVDGITSNRAVAQQARSSMNEVGAIIGKIKSAPPEHVVEKPTIGLIQAQLLH
ncbi:uncharacterized protein BDV17DRAFT_293874 [Aspergillus undulatus]|uniref:uncharacterized protein n=1 Tax=Aspergillus undulatus TaxID=1810928 RepID=UPI003CCDB3E0